MNNLSHYFTEAEDRRHGWNRETLEELLSDLVEKIPQAQSDWGEDEPWTTIISNDQVVAQVCAVIPIIMINKHFASCVQSVFKRYFVTVIEFSEYSAKTYSIDSNHLLRIFDIEAPADAAAFGIEESSERNFDSISIEEIWFYTM